MNDYRRDWENLEIGDEVFSKCKTGMGSGGYDYNIGNPVTHIDEMTIQSEEGRWCTSTREALSPPYAYYLEAYTKETNNKNN